MSLSLGTTEFINVCHHREGKDLLTQLVRKEIYDDQASAEVIAARFTDFKAPVLLLLRDGSLKQELDQLGGSMVPVFRLIASSRLDEEGLRQSLRALFRLRQKHERFSKNFDGLTLALGKQNCSAEMFC